MPEHQRATTDDGIVLTEEQVELRWADLLDGLAEAARRASAVWTELGQSWAALPPRTVS